MTITLESKDFTCAEGFNDSKIVDQLSLITRSGTLLEKGLAYRALTFIGQTAELGDFLTLLASDGKQLDPRTYSYVASSLSRVRDDGSLSLMALRLGTAEAGLRERMFQALYRCPDTCPRVFSV
jgi:hypothetical protein